MKLRESILPFELQPFGANPNETLGAGSYPNAVLFADPQQVPCKGTIIGFFLRQGHLTQPLRSKGREGNPDQLHTKVIKGFTVGRVRYDVLFLVVSFLKGFVLPFGPFYELFIGPGPFAN